MSGYFPKNILNTSTSNTDQNNTIYIGKVVSLSDNIYDDHIIKVRLRGVDDKVSDKQLTPCHPFLPKYLNIIPKKGEWVKILFWNTNNKSQNREYIGPIISQSQKLKKEDSESAFSNQQSFSIISPDISDKVVAESKGVYPNKEDVAIQGRDNTDIIQREREIVLRTGKHEIDNNLKLNKNNPGYSHTKMSDDGKVSSHNIVANKINLITHDGSPNLRTMIPDKTSDDVIDIFSGKISDKIQGQINKNAHSAVFGDKLVELLKLIIEYLRVHGHPHSNMGLNENSTGVDILKKIEKFDLSEGVFMSKNIKVN